MNGPAPQDTGGPDKGPPDYRYANPAWLKLHAVKQVAFEIAVFVRQDGNVQVSVFQKRHICRHFLFVSYRTDRIVYQNATICHYTPDNSYCVVMRSQSNI